MVGIDLAAATPAGDTWGPDRAADYLEDVPFAPFSKFDRLGKAADWTFSHYGRQARRGRNYQSSQAVNTVFSFQHADDSQFQLVDTKTVTTRQTGRGGGGRRGGHWGRGGRFGQREADRHDGGREVVAEKRKHLPARGKKDKRPFFRENILRVNYMPSVETDPEWDQLDVIQLATLTKLSMPAPAPETVAQHGTAPFLNKAIDSAGPRKPVPVGPTPKSAWRSPRAVEDRTLMRLLQAGQCNIVTTDKVLTALMTASRSVYPFDILLRKSGSSLVIDRRLRSHVDLCTSHETAPEGIPEDPTSPNAVPALVWESDAVNNKFQALSASREAHELGAAPEFDDAPRDIAPRGFRYQKFKLGGMDMVVRCEVDAVSRLRGEMVTWSVKALHEHDLRPGASGWRSKLTTQRGAVLATEIKNNGHKVARWAAQALMCGIDRLSLGYVSRKMASNRDKHELLSVLTLNPGELAQQIALNMDNCWGIVKGIVDLVMAGQDGLYLLTRDSSQPASLKLFRVPSDVFDEEEPEEYNPDLPERDS